MIAVNYQIYHCGRQINISSSSAIEASSTIDPNTIRIIPKKGDAV
jgi:hypothetical protein